MKTQTKNFKNKITLVIVIFELEQRQIFINVLRLKFLIQIFLKNENIDVKNVALKMHWSHEDGPNMVIIIMFILFTIGLEIKCSLEHF